MGTGASNRKNRSRSNQSSSQQLTSTQDRTNVYRLKSQSPDLLRNSPPVSPVERQSRTKQNTTQFAANQQSLTNNSTTPPVHSPTRPAQNETRRSYTPVSLPHTPVSNKLNPPKITNTKRSSSSSDSDNDDDHIDQEVLPHTDNRSNILSPNPSNASTPVSLPKINRSQIHSSSSKKHHTTLEEKTSGTLIEQTGHCPHCPHCQRFEVSKKYASPQPKWVMENPGTNHRHIIMDDYDEDAVQEKVILERGHLPGSYSYSPNLTIDERDKHEQTPGKYCTLPIIAKAGSPILPTRTPFPNYDAIQRREQRLNKPYTSTLFAD